MKQISPIRMRKASEDGYMLLAVIILLALFTISLSVALPKISKEIQRDRDVETMQRGKQYIRAIKMYYKKYGAYPPNMDALAKPMGVEKVRFLRKQYVDLTTGKKEWRPIHFGENKAPTAMGFFGQPIAGSSVAGMGPGTGGIAGASSIGGMGSTGGSSFGGSGIGGSETSGSGFGGSGSGLSSTGSGFGASGGTPGSAGDTSGVGSSSGTGSDPGSGQSFGGLGIIGFAPGSPKASILVYKKKSHYNEWEFVYDPLADQMMMGSGGAGLGGQPASGISNGIGNGTGTGSGLGGGSGIGGSGGGFGGAVGGSGFGGSSGSTPPEGGTNSQ